MKRECDFFDRPKTKKWVRICFYAVLVILFIADFFVFRDIHYSWQRLTGAFGIYGFLSCVVLVAVSKLLGRVLLQKREDYYE